VTERKTGLPETGRGKDCNTAGRERPAKGKRQYNSSQKAGREKGRGKPDRSEKVTTNGLPIQEEIAQLQEGKKGGGEPVDPKGLTLLHRGGCTLQGERGDQQK